MKYKVSIPSTSANVGPGFDIWGIAFDISNDFLFDIDQKSNLITGNPILTVSYSPFFEKTKIPNQSLELVFTDPNNPFIQAYNYLFTLYNYPSLSIPVHCYLSVPLSRGLGSSSTAIVGGLIVAKIVLEKIYSIEISQDEIYQIATKLEGHPDNVAACIFGGLILNLQNDINQKYTYLQLPLNAPIYFAGVIPILSLSTEKARGVVPKTFDRSVIAFQSARIAVLTHLFAKSIWDNTDKVLFFEALQDKIHQNQRSIFIPGMLETFEYWYTKGAIGAYLSGAGSTLMGVWDTDINIETIDLVQELNKKNIQAIPFKAKLNKKGVIITESLN